MNKEKYLDDLKEIKDMMERSSRFISLSGLSGISAGTFALIATYLAYKTVYINQNYLSYRSAILTKETLTTLLLIAVVTLFLSIGAGILFTIIKAKKTNNNLWDLQTKRLLINLFIPLITGGIFCLMLLLKGYISLVAPLTLIFYGLALVNASKYSLSEIRSLGLIEIMLGLLATYFIGYGLIFWALGFGILHIVYGIVMQIRYGS
ncbi:MAG: hypothetical protein ABFS38_08165 [Bacteroidota bacterium]